MDEVDIYIARNSLRANSSSIWRNNGADIFSRSSTRDDYDDEEALKWAALQKLATYNRLKKGLLVKSDSAGVNGIDEVDIQNLGVQEKKELLERLMRDSEGGNEKFLLKLRKRLDRVGIDLPKIEVRFEHLKVDAKVYVGSRALPTFLNSVWNTLEGFLNCLHILPDRKKNLSILRDVSGIIKPGRMALLLGPPSSGKTTLLLALAGKLDPDLKVSGTVTYNGHGMNEFVPHRTAAYISQNDCHLGEMTVKETLAFSARCQGIGFRYEMLSELSRREKEANIKPDPDLDLFMKAAAIEGQEASVVADYVLKLLGLEICADTVVGNDMMRGVSGGQKKRVTTGEMLVGPSNALFMDEISTGLDSSTTFQIVNSLRHTVHILQGTALISLLQPAPETYDLFDDIILLSDGYVVYQGPREHVLQFFESMGFKCPDRKGVADFLQEVTSKQDQEQYWLRRDEPYRFITAEKFSRAYQTFHVGRRMRHDLRTPFDKSKSHPAALTTNKFGVKKMELLRACTSREILLMKRNAFVYVFKSTQFVIMALITLSLFPRPIMHRESVTDGSMYMGALFYGVMSIMLNGIAEMPMTIARLPVFYKQRDLKFHPPWSYALPTWVIKIPISLIEAFVWVVLTYYVIGLDPNVGRFFKQYLLLVLINQMGSALFRCIAALSRNLVVAGKFGSFSLLILFALGGFVLSRVNVKVWWIWGYWISPMMYGMNAIAVNEFLGHQWSHVLPNTTEPLGVIILKSRGFFPDASWYWIGVGALLGFVLLFNLCFTLAVTFLNPIGKPQAVMPEESNNRFSKDRGDHIRRNLPSCGEANHNRRKGMVLPFEPHSITFDEIKYSVDMPQQLKEQGITEEKLMLLKGVSGAFRPGVLTALMGVSGAGKTTLMDVLAGRKTGGYIDGHITISGYPKNQETFARISGYCEQNDIHSPHVTVYESLLYSAWLRLPSDIDSGSKKMFVDEVMELVELKSLRDALVGLPGVSGLSTEQRKRLTIAVELVANPSIIFMDEPTSGLDARAAAIVMRTVRNTVDTGRTVVCTIHQPSIDIFEAFDELLLMKQGGLELYVGPVGRYSCELIKYFEKIEGIRKITEGCNPATWALEVTSSKQEMILGIDFTEVYKNSDLYRRNKALIRELSTPRPGSRDLSFRTQYAQSFLSQFMTCLWKQRASYWRDPPYTAARFFFTTFIALLYGSIFWDLGSKRGSQQDLFNSIGSMYSSVLFIGAQNASSVQPVVTVERTVFYRERAAGMYSSWSYALAQVLVEIPYIFFQSVVYGAIVYSMIGFEWNAEKFFWYLYFMFTTLLYYTFYGMMTVGVTPNPSVASIIASSFYGIWNLFSGFIVPKPRMPVWWRWYYYVSPVSWTLYGLTASQFGDLKDVMKDEHVSVQEFLQTYFGFRHDYVGFCAAAVLGFVLLFAFVFAFSIRVLKFQNR
ncbi:pleiotropic drug resistance protein 1-like [Apium graveolens]|uniref:pleiotropic drug resistance protein 1-like n=1 Tax=Apium graveolens TaxID=4045 RepID=UPI003D7A4E80